MKYAFFYYSLNHFIKLFQFLQFKKYNIDYKFIDFCVTKLKTYSVILIND